MRRLNPPLVRSSSREGMMRLLRIIIGSLFFFCLPVTCFAIGKPFSATYAATKHRNLSHLSNSDKNAANGIGTAVTATNKKDYRNEASGLFNNVRIPAALFAGAAAGLVFAMPLAMQDGVRLGMVKRIYALLLLSSFGSQMVAVLVSTLCVSTLATRDANDAESSLSSSNWETSSLLEFLNNHYALEWVAVRFHFLSGVLSFVVGMGLRAWVSISCPIISNAALGLLASCTLLCLGFIQESSSEVLYGMLGLPFLYCQALWTKMIGGGQSKNKNSSWLFVFAFCFAAATKLYILANLPHMIQFLSPTTS